MFLVLRVRVVEKYLVETVVFDKLHMLKSFSRVSHRAPLQWQPLCSINSLQCTNSTRSASTVRKKFEFEMLKRYKSVTNLIYIYVKFGES